jgi:hypothetical protein
MKAIKINNKIEKFSRLPKTWEDANGLHLNIGDGSAQGFKDLITPEFDSRIEELGAIIESGDTYTFEVLAKNIKESLATLKSQKIQKIKDELGLILSKTDWYIVREYDTNQQTPQEIKDQRNSLRQKSNELENQINDLTTKKAVVLFDINL